MIENIKNRKSKYIPSEVEEIVTDLASMTLKNERIKCNVEDLWLQSLRMKVIEE